jgi:hypothetical protein
MILPPFCRVCKDNCECISYHDLECGGPGDWPLCSCPHSEVNTAAASEPGTRPVRRYTAERICPQCAALRTVEVGTQEPEVIAYRCSQGHEWMVTL